MFHALSAASTSATCGGRSPSSAKNSTAVLALWDRGSVKPLIDRTYTFTEAATAHRRLLQHQNTGKVVLKP